MSSYKAVIFDIGGVCVGSPLAAINKYEKTHGLPKDYINVAITKRGDQGAFQKLERGELKIAEFYERFGSELSDPRNKEYYASYMQKLGLAPQSIPQVVNIDGKELFRMMMCESAILDTRVFDAIRRLKASGRFRLAALTNNFQYPDNDPREVELLGGRPPAELVGLFDEFIESSAVGLRKPDPKIFLYACELLKIRPEDAIFLDDIGMNLKSAQDVGMRTIRVKLGRSEEAIQELQSLVKLPLVDGPSSKL